MTYSQATELAKIFSAMAEPRQLLILDILRENGSNTMLLRDLADKANVSESKARSFCEELERAYILDQDNMGGEAAYRFHTTSTAKKVDALLNRLV